MPLLSPSASATGWLPRVAGFAAAVVLAHLPLWVLSQFYAIERAQVSVDLLLAIALLARHPVWGVALMVLCWAVDGVVSQSTAYHFLSPVAFLDSLRGAGDLRLAGFVSWEAAGSLLVFIGVACASCWLARRRRPEWGMTLTAIFAVAVLDLLNGSSRYALADRRAVPFNIAGSPIVSFSRQLDASRRRDPPVTLATGESVAVAADLAVWARAHPDRSIWLVMVESMGWIQNEALRQQMLSAADSALRDDAYRIERHQLRFKGSTTYGELRSLCGVIGAYADLSDEQAAKCLPARLAGLGWTTVGVHGFSGRMFDRRGWWPRIGLRQTLFLEDLVGELPVCGGAFRGVCDMELLQLSARRVKAQRQFVYTLTLNTHLPIDPVEVPVAWQALCDREHVLRDVCELTAAQSRVLATVADLARNLPSPRPLVVVIGDHAPPFLDRRARAAFDQSTVPALILRPD
jgi:hypothetical protein